jgi:hypothetical protein
MHLHPLIGGETAGTLEALAPPSDGSPLLGGAGVDHSIFIMTTERTLHDLAGDLPRKGERDGWNTIFSNSKEIMHNILYLSRKFAGQGGRQEKRSGRD